MLDLRVPIPVISVMLIVASIYASIEVTVQQRIENGKMPD